MFKDLFEFLYKDEKKDLKEASILDPEDEFEDVPLPKDEFDEPKQATEAPVQEPLPPAEDEAEFEDYLWREDIEGLKAILNSPRMEVYRKNLNPRLLQIVQTVLKRKMLGEKKVVEAEVKCRYCGRPSEDKSGVCAACSKKYEENESKVVESPTAEPDTETEAPPTQKPSKPRNPIVPEPGIHPKPKARVDDIQKFLAMRRNRMGEGVTGSTGSYSPTGSKGMSGVIKMSEQEITEGIKTWRKHRKPFKQTESKVEPVVELSMDELLEKYDLTESSLNIIQDLQDLLMRYDLFDEALMDSLTDRIADYMSSVPGVGDALASKYNVSDEPAEPVQAEEPIEPKVHEAVVNGRKIVEYEEEPKKRKKDQDLVGQPITMADKSEIKPEATFTPPPKPEGEPSEPTNVNAEDKFKEPATEEEPLAEPVSTEAPAADLGKEEELIGPDAGGGDVGIEGEPGEAGKPAMPPSGGPSGASPDLMPPSGGEGPTAQPIPTEPSQPSADLDAVNAQLQMDYPEEPMASTAKAYADSLIDDPQVYGRIRDLKWQGVYTNADTFLKQAKIVGSYNKFNPEVAKRLVDKFGEGAKYRLGRDKSVVLFITVRDTDQQFSTEAIKDLADADKVETTNNVGEVRIWWD